MRSLRAGLLALVLGACAHLQQESPLAADWSVSETWHDETRVALTLQLKRVHVGADAAGAAALRQHAQGLMQQRGFARYTILRYEEHLSSNWIAQRHAYGEIAFER